MNTQAPLIELNTTRAPSGMDRLQLAGIARALALSLCLLITLASMISLALSIYSLNLWDRLPAADSARYFPGITIDSIQAHADWQSMVLRSGLSLLGYAWIFTVARLVGGVSLLLVSMLLIRRYSAHRAAVLMAMVLPLLAAAGMWQNSLFDWAVAIAPWMKYPAQILGWLTWCGAIAVYIFPDGRFKPRWTAVLAVLLVPLTFLRAFGLDVALNPDHWPGLSYLALNVLVIGGVLVAVLSRRAQAADPAQVRAVRWYTLGWGLLVADYFLNLLLNDVYYFFAGHLAFEGAASLAYVLINEPVWFALEAFLATGLAIAVFREGLLAISG